MKILFLLTQDLESPSGAGRYFPLARELAALGNQVTIAALHSDYAALSEKRFRRDGVNVQYVAQMHVRKKGDRKAYFSFFELIPIALGATWKLSLMALRTPADIIHIAKPHPMNSLAGLAAKILRRIVIFLDCDDHEASSNRFSAKWQQFGVALFENSVPRHVHHVTTHNTFLRNLLLEIGISSERITYLPNGVDVKRFANVDESRVQALRRSLRLEGCKVVAYIGSLSAPAHSVNLLLDAFRRLNLQLPNSLLLIVGGGEEYDRLQESTRSLGLSDVVRFTGRVPSAEAPLYYRLADVVVDPVYDEPAARGRLPLKMFESWISGTPFLTGDVGDRRMVMGEPPAGLIVPPGDAQAIADTLLDLLRDPALVETLRQRGLRRAQDYTWEKLARQLNEVYRSYLERLPQLPPSRRFGRDP
jgi:glycosyltransferase involved in cell wall biosynthesis